MELLLTVSKQRPGTLRAQIEEQFRVAIRDGSLRAGSPIPSTRDLAGQLGVSRKVAVDAYAQLTAEGYLAMRQGAQPRVASGPFRPADQGRRAPASARALRYDFLPARPDVSSFPREAWARCLREAVMEITVADLGYGDAFGVDALREGLADYLGRVRGVVADPGRVVVTNGYLQGLGLICRTLATRGARRIALEDPSSWEEDHIAERAGLRPVRVPVDDLGLDVTALDRAGADAVVLTPAHQHPTGVVLAPERRAALVAWLRDRDAIAIEDDYDAEYRYDRPAVGALQGLDHHHVVYAGTVSKVLAPALRLGWMVIPPALVDPVRLERQLFDQGTARIEQHAFALFLARGDLDRHLRRMRIRYRARRDVIIGALATELPEADVRGISAGLHVTVALPASDDEAAVRKAAAARGIGLSTLADYTALGDSTGLGGSTGLGDFTPADVRLAGHRTTARHPPTLVLGYCQMSDSRIRDGIRELAAVIRATRKARA